MTGSSLAGIITASATVITACGGLFLALAVFLPQMRETKKIALAGRQAAEQSRDQIIQVHTMVNQQRTDMMRYQERLIEALTASGIEVPRDSSLRPNPHPFTGDPQEQPI